MMSFVNPGYLLLLVLLPVSILFWIWRGRVHDKNWRRLGNETLISKLIPSELPPLRSWKFVLWLGVIAALIIALARPLWGEEVNISETQGVSIMIVLDVSRSMNAQDIAPSRLERAKLSITDMFAELAGNEFGMILFAGSAFVNFPLTTDTTSLGTFLKAASSDAISRQGTNIDAALRLAIDGLRNTSTSQPIIVLMTDGENHTVDPLIAASLAAEQGIVIHVIGYGSPEGVPIPVRDENGNEVGFQRDRAGNLVLSALNESLLKEIANRTGGIYQRATSNSTEISSLIDIVNQLSPDNLGTFTETRPIERFGIFVGLALIALSLEILLPEAREMKK